MIHFLLHDVVVSDRLYPFLRLQNLSLEEYQESVEGMKKLTKIIHYYIFLKEPTLFVRIGQNPSKSAGISLNSPVFTLILY